MQAHTEYNLLKVFQLNTLSEKTKIEALYSTVQNIKIYFFCLKMKVSWNQPYWKKIMSNYQNNRPRM